MQEPIVARAIVLQPAFKNRVDDMRAFVAVEAGVVRFVKALPDLIGGMAVRKRRDRSRVPAGVAQPFGKGVERAGAAEFAFTAFYSHIRAHTTVVHDTRLYSKSPSKKCCS